MHICAAGHCCILLWRRLWICSLQSVEVLFAMSCAVRAHVLQYSLDLLQAAKQQEGHCTTTALLQQACPDTFDG